MPKDHSMLHDFCIPLLCIRSVYHFLFVLCDFQSIKKDLRIFNQATQKNLTIVGQKKIADFTEIRFNLRLADKALVIWSYEGFATFHIL